MASLFAPVPNAMTWFESRQRERTLAQLRHEIQLASIDETPSKQERKRENQRERAMR